MSGAPSIVGQELKVSERVTVYVSPRHLQTFRAGHVYRIFPTPHDWDLLDAKAQGARLKSLGRGNCFAHAAKAVKSKGAGVIAPPEKES